MPKKSPAPTSTEPQPLQAANQAPETQPAASQTADLATAPQPTVDEAASVGNNTASPTSTNQQGSPMKKPTPALIALIVVVPIVAGIATGFGLEQLFAGSSGNVQTGTLSDGTQLQQVPTASVQPGDIFGSADESTFKDQAQGVLQIGGFEGEGSHRLLRDGGDDQTVYLTSSITDLSEFEDMEIKIWGETFKGQRVGWLMDVGRVEVIATQADLPEWAADQAADSAE